MRQSLPPVQSSLLLATLGSESQVITAALDLLNGQGENITRVLVMHTSGNQPEFIKAQERLREAFDQPPYAGKNLLDLRPIQDEHGRLLEDVSTPSTTQAAFRYLYQQVRLAKLDNYRIHLGIAGGRKSLSLFSMAAAQMLCDENDRIWYLYSGGDFLTSKRLHPGPGDDVHLIPIPFIRWSQVTPVWTGLKSVEDPFEAEEYIRNSQLYDRLEQARSYLFGSLTPAERRVVELLAHESLSDQEIAGRLSISPRTVEQHLRSAYQKARDHWGLSAVDRVQLVNLLSLYIQLSDEALTE